MPWPKKLQEKWQSKEQYMEYIEKKRDKNNRIINRSATLEANQVKEGDVIRIQPCLVGGMRRYKKLKNESYNGYSLSRIFS